MAYINAEADPSVLQSYFKTLPSDFAYNGALPVAATPLAGPAGPAEGPDFVNPLIASPYAGAAYNPYGYAGHPGYGYGAGGYGNGGGGYGAGVGGYGAGSYGANDGGYGAGGGGYGSG